MFNPDNLSPDELAESLYAHKVALLAVATMAELRESETESHLLRVQNYVRALCAKLATRAEYSAILTDKYVQLLCSSVFIYDLGTVAIPDRILLKPGRLTDDELSIMRTHTSIGYEAIVRAEKTLGKTTQRLTIAKELTLSHQEKWNGKGYPQGLAGTLIPLSARIVALADVYDALITQKVYKDGMSHDAAVKVIASERGGHFDPNITDAFLEIQQQFKEISQKFADTERDMQQKIEYLANAIAEHVEL
jgi:putative two-component system response regulator